MSILTPTPEWLEEETHDPEKSAEDLLRRLGFSGKLRGFRYLTSAIAQTVVDPDRIFLITKVLYPDVAKQYQTTASKVERTMRHAIRNFWEHGGRETLEQVTGVHLTQRPTNSQFIDLVSAYIRYL